MAPMADTAMRLFYHRLFELDPELGESLPPDVLVECRTRLQQVLGAVVTALPAAGEPHPTTDNGGGCPHVACALLWMLERGLGNRFTPAVRAAWAEALERHAARVTRAALGDPAARIVPPPLHHRGLVPLGS
ncbi:MAG TPA: hypothetical protein VFX98_19220 [Longimicrobiaceae bacterium]|nr:hypothetical protein [Longimicrobiaceae bacterium]